jgi:4-hydroxy-tetrahydrodipicolinate synthase
MRLSRKVNWNCWLTPYTLNDMTLTGLFVPLITPFAADGAVAVDSLATLAHELLEDGANGLVALGTTGEPAALTDAEQLTVVDVIGRVCLEKGAPLIVGAGRHHPAAVAALHVVPPFVRPGEDGVVAWFERVGRESPLPVLVYHIPYRTGQHLSVDALRRLAALPGVAGVKYAVGGIDADSVALLADPPTDFVVLGGDDVFVAALLALGAHGGILASAHLATASFASLLDNPTEWGPLATLAAALFAEPNPTVIKAVLHAQGRIPTPDVRLPLVRASAEARDRAVRAVESVPRPARLHR